MTPTPLEALKACADQFAFYAEEHRKAGKIEKAETNERFRDMARQALTGAGVPVGLTADDVEWVTNDIAELGVKIGGQFFFLYKGYSLQYKDCQHDDGRPMMWRPVKKREFGECAHPINYDNLNLIGKVSLDDSDEWKPMTHITTPVITTPDPAPNHEAVAKAIYAVMRRKAGVLTKDGIEYPPEWVEGGNSQKQDEARDYADGVLSLYHQDLLQVKP